MRRFLIVLLFFSVPAVASAIIQTTEMGGAEPTILPAGGAFAWLQGLFDSVSALF